MSIILNIPEEEFFSKIKKINAIIFDLDDTLLDSNKNIPYRALAAIRELQNKDYFISFCTARNAVASQYYAYMINIKGVYSAVSGCQLVEAQTGVCLRSHKIPEESVLQLVRYLLECGAPFSLSTNQKGYIGGQIDLDGEYLMINNRRKKIVDPVYHIERLMDPSVLCGQTINKIVVHSEDYYDAVCSVISYSVSDVQCAITSKGIINIFPFGFNKGTGIREISKHMKIDPKNICVFGDFHNDIPMFKVAGLSVAMGNSAEDVQKSASVITETADNDGIAEFLVRFLMKKETL